MKKEDLIRVATIIDCEGSIGIYGIHDYYKGRKREKMRPRPQVSASNTVKWYLKNYIKDILKIGRIHPASSSNKQCWSWVVTYRQALKVCKTLLPFLIIKKPNALRIIKYYENKDKIGMTSQHYFAKVRKNNINKLRGKIKGLSGIKLSYALNVFSLENGLSEKTVRRYCRLLQNNNK